MKKPKLYTKEPNGRYKEYVEIEPKYDNALYRRVGKRYEPVSMSDVCTSLPEGIWVVMRNKYYLQTSNSD